MARKPTSITAKGRGLIWSRSLKAAERRVADGESYLIMRNGGWFRPGAHGYTGEIGDAGVFLGKDAKGYLSAEGVVLYPVSMLKARIRKEVGETTARAVRLTQMMMGMDAPAQR